MSSDATVILALDAMAEAHDRKMWDKAVSIGDAWIEARGELNIVAATLYAQALQGVGRYGDAVRWARVAALNMPSEHAVALAGARSTYAQALARVGDFPAAKRVLKQLIAAEIDHPEATEKQGHLLLAITNDWKRGWAMHEHRLLQDGKGFPDYTRPWDGVTREPVCVLHEQGIGDAVLFARWLPWLSETTGHVVTWFGPALLHSWIGALPGVKIGTAEDEAAARASGTLLPSVFAMSLPYFAKLGRPHHVPPPLAPASLLADRRALALSRSHRDVRVGVCWKGASYGWHDYERSFTVEDFLPVIAPCEGVGFINLCHDAEVPAGAPFSRTQFEDIYTTGEFVAMCDLVVTVDTSVAHIAGSLGVPTLVIAPTVPDWRYQWPRGSSTPFYPSVTVCRRKHGTDRSVLTTARAMIERFAGRLQVQAA